jgi:Glycosyltransferase family 87
MTTALGIRSRTLLWAVLALFVCVVRGPEFISSLRPQPTQGMDFFQEWSSARNWREGLPIYMDLDDAAQRHLGRQRVADERWLFVKNAHPPAAVLLALPIATFSYPNGMLAWNLLSFVALAVALWLIVRGLRLPVEPWMVFPLIVVALLCNPFRQQVNHGQLNLMLLAVIVGAWAAERSSRLRAAGALIGLAAAIKLFPAFLLLYYAVRRRWEVVMWGLAAFFLATLLSIAVLGVEALTSYVRDVMPAVSGYRNLSVNASLQGFWMKWFDEGAIHPLTVPRLPDIPPLFEHPVLATSGFMLSALMVLWAWTRAVRRLEPDLAFGLTLITMLMLSPVTWDHYFLLLLLPVVLLWRTFPEPRWERIALILFLIPLAMSPTTFATASTGTNTFVALVGVSVHFFALTGLFLLALRSPRAELPPRPR